MAISSGRGWRNEFQLRRSVRRLLRDLDIDAPLDVRELCDRLGRQRQREIKLVPYQLPVPGPFGMWSDVGGTDWILYQRDTTPGHQEHIILHEIGHLISGHDSAETGDDIWAQIFPDIPLEMVRRALRRDGYEPHHEWEAEMVATVIKDWARLVDRLQHGSDHAGPTAKRLRGAFDDHQGWL
ncbi:hypothetical protein [Saccharopolyspora cebuensis]|uniref:IrrE N-terminal-like domain-containing protein n=1 Tax=Saccharopolyspora cebuensis TaxID=418759 RepID=A0ABV4CSE3_9PSEU